jgi:hypothetical protein
VIVCGWCASATEPGLCSHCGRDPALPWTQRNTEPPIASAEGEPAGRPKLDAGQIRAKLRIARKDNPDATNAMLADLLGISERTLGRWQKLSS